MQQPNYKVPTLYADFFPHLGHSFFGVLNCTDLFWRFWQWLGVNQQFEIFCALSPLPGPFHHLHAHFQKQQEAQLQAHGASQQRVHCLLLQGFFLDL
jgi:hypothetical protein